MAVRVKRPNIAGFFTFEAKLGANEVLFLPVHRAKTHSGTNLVAVAADTGTTVQVTIDHPDNFMPQVPAGQAYTSTITGEYTGVTTPGAGVRIWGAAISITSDIVEINKHMTAMKITAPAGGCTVTVYGDY